MGKLGLVFISQVENSPILLCCTSLRTYFHSDELLNESGKLPRLKSRNPSASRIQEPSREGNKRMEPEMRENEDKIAPFSRLFFRKQKAGLAPKLKPATKGGSGD